MAKIQIEMFSTVQCVCGEVLNQVKIENDDGLITTVTPCSFCQEEARRQAYDKGYEQSMKHAAGDY